MPLMIGKEVTHIEEGDLLVFDGNRKLGIRRNGEVINFKMDCGCFHDYFYLRGNIDYRTIANLLAVASGFSCAVKVVREGFEGANVVLYEIMS